MPRTRRGMVLFWSALFIVSIVLQYAAAALPNGALATVAAPAECESYAIFTSNEAGTTNNENFYDSKPEVWLNGGPASAGGNLTEGTVFYYRVEEPNGTPLSAIRSVTVGADGRFLTSLAPFDTTTNPGGSYNVVVSAFSDLHQGGGCTKNDHFKVADQGALKITKTVTGGPADFSGTFKVSVDCGDAGSFADKTIAFPNPGFITLTGLDAKAVCTVSEDAPLAAPEGYDWGTPTYAGNPATIVSDGTVTVGVVNHLNLIPKPGFSILKSVSLGADGPWVDSLTTTTGTTVHYRITVTNTGNVALTSVTLADNKTLDLVAAGCTIPATLAIGTSFDCNYSNSAATGTVVNTATADTEETGSASDTATVVASVTPQPANPTLTIGKTNDAPLKTIAGVQLPTANEGSTVTFTLAYSFTGDSVTNGMISDVLPAGLTYVTGSATSNGVFTFVGYDAGTRTLSWTAEAVTASGSLSYKATADVGAAALAQPLKNVASIQSEDTAKVSDDSVVFVPTVPLAETSVPTAPRTDALASSGTSAPGSSLMLVLFALAAIVFAIVFVTPMPASIRERTRRR